MTVPRRCCRPGCPHYAVATLTFVYSDSTAVVGPLATAREPHSWDLCVSHGSRITAPRGWELVRHSGPLTAPSEDDDLIALAEAVREGCDVVSSGPLANGPARAGGAHMSDCGSAPATTAPGVGVLVTSGQTAAGTGRRRGHLRVLPDLPGERA